jgi:allantoinase
MSTKMAQRFRLPAKGTLDVGVDADIALVALDEEQTLRAEDLLDRHKLSPYRGRTFRGRVVRTILRGETIFCEGRIAGEPRGQFLRPASL